jgi:glycosyltransferase involved in cell wall biosynthesis
MTEMKSDDSRSIILFTIAIDSKDLILAQTLDWVKGMASIFKEVHVFALRIENGAILPNNVFLFCNGGRTKFLKLLKLIKTYTKLKNVIRHNDAVVFYHMLTWPILMFGQFFKIRGLKQGVWYSHNYADFALRTTGCLVDKYFSPTINTFPLINKSKLVATGHAVDFKDFPSYTEKIGQWHLDEIFYIGRITPVKRLELLIEALAGINYNRRMPVNFKIIGPTQDSNYLKKLFKEATDVGVQLDVIEPLTRERLIPLLKNVKFIFSGTPASVDKSILEACGSGAIPITNNMEVLELTGMDTVWRKLSIGPAPLIQQQITLLMNSSAETLFKISAQVQDSTRLQNNFERTLLRIKKELS